MKVINPGLVLVKFTVSHDMSKYHPYARIVIVLNFLHLRTYICIGCIEIWLPGMVNYIMDVPLAIVLILQMWWSNALLQITDYRSNGLTGAPLRRVRRGEGHDSRGADSLRRWPEVKGCWGQRNSFSLSQPEQWTSSANALLVLWDMILDLQLLDCKLISLCYLKNVLNVLPSFQTICQHTNRKLTHQDALLLLKMMTKLQCHITKWDIYHQTRVEKKPELCSNPEEGKHSKQKATHSSLSIQKPWIWKEQKRTDTETTQFGWPQESCHQLSCFHTEFCLKQKYHLFYLKH